MKTLQILGTGCPKCRKLAETTEEAAKSLGLEYRMEKVTDIQAIMGFGVMMTPALAVDGVVKVRLVGACKGCPMSQLTLANGVERVLKEQIPEVARVEPV